MFARVFCSLPCVLALALPASATDWIVDAAGGQGTLATIAQAMAVCSTGDRILVMPGSYPAFHFSRAVDVVGLGASPSDVVIHRVDYHPTVPTLGFDTGLTNLTVCGDSISISGNELAPGTLVLDGVRACSGVYLHGAGQFYLLVQNADVEAGPGDGFLGAAFDFGGGTADIVNSSIRGANASAVVGTTAGVGLRVWSTSTSNVRISNSLVSGGSGMRATGFLDGADAIDHLAGGVSTLRLSGGAQILGGAADVGGRGGNGVDISGEITTGEVVVIGGAGGTPGSPYATSQPTPLGFDPLLRLSPAGQGGTLPVFQHPGDFILAGCDPSISSAVLASSTAIDPPSTPASTALVTPQVGNGPTEAFLIPIRQHRVANPAPKRRLYLQGLFLDASTGQTHTTNPVAMTIDP